MATKQQLIRRCKELGICLTDEGDKLELFCPPRKLLPNTCHFYTYWTRGWMRSDLYDSILQDLEGEMGECEEIDCDSCTGPWIPDDVPDTAILTKPDKV